MPTLSIMSIVVTKVTFEPKFMIWFQFSDGSIVSALECGLMDMEAIAKELQEEDWIALREAFREPGKWVKI